LSREENRTELSFIGLEEQMTASAEVCRFKAKVTRPKVTTDEKRSPQEMPTKHGLLNAHRWLWVDFLQGIVQGLIDEYEPSTASEHLLIQQVAMGWLRLHKALGSRGRDR